MSDEIQYVSAPNEKESPATTTNDMGTDSGVLAQVRKFSRDPKGQARLLLRHLGLIYRVLRHPRTPWNARLAAGLAMGYVVSPVQFIPSFIPVIGQLDDVAVILLTVKFVHRWTPSAILAECSDPNRAFQNRRKPKFAPGESQRPVLTTE
jgi:uncharacterized membrane protein YkvA (DUF1232 family)